MLILRNAVSFMTLKIGKNATFSPKNYLDTAEHI